MLSKYWKHDALVKLSHTLVRTVSAYRCPHIVCGARIRLVGETLVHRHATSNHTSSTQNYLLLLLPCSLNLHNGNEVRTCRALQSCSFGALERCRERVVHTPTQASRCKTSSLGPAARSFAVVLFRLLVVMMRRW